MLGYMNHGLLARAEDMPGKGGSSMLPLGLCKAYIASDLGASALLSVIVGACMACCKAVIGQVYVERLYEVGSLASDKLEHVGGQPSSQNRLPGR